MVARYQQLAVELRQAILRGTYPPGSVLPHFTELSEQHNMARQTVSEAIRVLENEGLVRAIRHRGTVVLDRTPVRVHLSRYQSVLGSGGQLGPWEQACQRQGLEGRMETVEVEREAAPTEVAEALGLEPGAEVVRRSRRALIDEEAVQLHTAWYPYDVVRGTPLEESGKVIGGVYGALAASGHQPTTVDETVMARQPTTDEAAELRLRGVPVLVVERVTRGADGKPLELLQVVADTTRTVLVYDALPLLPV